MMKYWAPRLAVARPPRHISAMHLNTTKPLATTKTIALLLCLTACHGRKSDDTAGVPASPTDAATAPMTEGEIVGALLGATNAMSLADSAAAGVIVSPSVNHYALILRADERAIGQEIQAVADTIKVARAESPVATRLATEATQIGTALSDSTVDRTSAFVESQIQMQRHMIGAMDSLMIPSARTPALRQVLQDLRPAMVAHLQRAEQLKQILATATTSAPRVAARISPDSARAPGDTTGRNASGSGTPKTDTAKVIKPDTIHLR